MLYASADQSVVVSLLDWPERVGTVRAAKGAGHRPFVLYPTPVHAMFAAREPHPVVLAVDYRPVADDPPAWPCGVEVTDPDEDYLCRVVHPPYAVDDDPFTLAAAASFLASVRAHRADLARWSGYLFHAAASTLTAAPNETIDVFNAAVESFPGGLREFPAPDGVVWPEDAWEFIKDKKWLSH